MTVEYQHFAARNTEKMNIVHSRKKNDKGMFRFFLVSAFAFLCTMFTLIMENFGEQCYLQEKKDVSAFQLYKGSWTVLKEVVMDHY
jgi:hypothetical protein